MPGADKEKSEEQAWQCPCVPLCEEKKGLPSGNELPKLEVTVTQL